MAEDNLAYPINVYQGATFTLPMFFYDEDDNVVNLAGCTARMQIRQTVPATGDPIVDLTTENGGLIIDVTAGSITAVIDADDTSELPVLVGVYDVFLTGPGITVEVLLAGVATIQGRVTK